MKRVLQNPKVITATSTILLLTCAVWISVVHEINSDLEKNIKEERLKSEAFLSEKLSLDKEIAKMKNEFKNLIGQNAALDKVIFDANKQLSQKEVEVSQMRKETRSISDIKKKYDELKRIRQELEQQLALVNTTIVALKKENADLINTIAILESKNKNLAEELNYIKLTAIDDIRIEAVKKKNQQLTATAKKTRKMIVTFEVLDALKSDLNYTIIGPAGKPLSDKNGSITSILLPDELVITASVSTASAPKKKQIQMVYETKEQLQGGIYTIEVSSNGLHIGSLQVRLR
jgi:predicted  nucleic acid-binding Zn-ribbon protein